MWIEQLIFSSINHAAQAFYVDMLSRGYVLLSDMREFTKNLPPLQQTGWNSYRLSSNLTYTVEALHLL
jgi:transketolase N-terminal domain/subunit